MEEIQSWWEVPAVAHFCYVFRSAFNLVFFEIAELESALLNIQDPDMSISLDQLIIRLLQGCLDEESVTEGNWEEKLHELFNENCEDEENPFDDSQNFFQLTPRSKIEILLRLCELRLDVEGALEAIKSIPPEDMQAKCMGKDSQNNTYWYFCDERLYKEDSSSEKKSNQNQKKKEVKNSVSKSKPVNTREKRTKANSDINKSWTVACFNVSDWEKLLKTLSKSKNIQQKELSKEIKNHLPILQERVSEKDHLLRKRFLELAPKRTSSRISKVQEKKKLEELKAQEEARLAKLEAEKEQARKEALRLKEEKEGRRKRAEMRHQAVEERAKRAQIREMSRGAKSEDSDSSSDQDYSAYEKNRNNSVRSKIQRNLQTIEEHSDESETSDDEKSDSGSDYETSNVYHQRTRKRKELQRYTDKSRKLTMRNKNNRCLRTYSRYNEQSRTNQTRSSSRLQDKQKTVKYRFDTDESEHSSSAESPMETDESKVSTRLQQNRWKSEDQSESDSEESDDKNDDSSSNSESSSDTEREKTYNVKNEDSISMQNNPKTSSSSNSNKSQDTSLNLSQVKLYKTTLLKDPSDASKWSAVLDSKGQKLHILNGSCDNFSSKKLKLDEGKIFRTSTPNMKSSLLKENHIYQPVRQTPFITYGKIVPSSPSIVRLDFRKPPNHQVSS